jgi:hypothetical protein
MHLQTQVSVVVQNDVKKKQVSSDETATSRKSYRFGVIVLLSSVEGTFFAITIFYFIAKSTDLLAYSSRLPSHKILSFSPLAFCVAIIPSLMALFGAVYMKAGNFEYTTGTNNAGNHHEKSSFSILDEEMETSSKKVTDHDLSSDDESNLVDENPSQGIIFKAAVIGFACRLIFETAGAAFWLVLFLSNGVKNFFSHDKIALCSLLFVCIAVGGLRSVAEVRAYGNTIKKSQQLNNTEEGSVEEDENDPHQTTDISDSRSDPLIGMSLIISFVLTTIGYFSTIHPDAIFSFKGAVTIVMAIFTIYAECACKHAKLCINKTAIPDISKKAAASNKNETDASEDEADKPDELSQMSIKERLAYYIRHYIWYVILSAFHNVAHFVQKTLPACLSLLTCFTEHYHLSSKYLLIFWIIAAIPAIIWARIAMKEDLFNLTELAHKKEASKKSNIKAIANLESPQCNDIIPSGLCKPPVLFNNNKKLQDPPSTCRAEAQIIQNYLNSQEVIQLNTSINAAPILTY